MKKFKSLDEQISYLSQSKNITIEDEEKVREYLLCHNYYNVISVAKVKFVRYFVEGKHRYDVSDFREWQRYYENDILISKQLIFQVVDLEKEVNSKLAYYLSEMIEMHQLNDDLKEKIKTTINSDINNRARNYNFSETWVYITKSTFGTVVKLIDLLDKVTQKKIMPKSFGIKQLKELKNLRNNLFHLTPLNVYLTNSQNTSQQVKQRRFSLIEKLVDNDEILQEMITNCKKFNRIKENSTRVE